MRVGVNSRLFQYADTGISIFIKSLYKNIINNSKVNYDNLFFFQTNLNKKIGKTKKINTKFLSSDILFDLYQINDLIKKYNIDIFHGPSNILPLTKQKRTKYALTIHDLSFLTLPKLNNFFFRNYYKVMVGESIRRADLVICDSESTKNDVLNFYQHRNYDLEVIPLAIEKNKYQNIKSLKNPINNEYILTLCTHPKRKNIKNILTAYSKSSLRYRYKFILAGYIEKVAIDDFRKLIKNLKIENNVIITGFIDEKELEAYYRYASFFIYASFYEGFGLPILEAMHFKVPILTSNISSMTEFNIPKEFLVNPYDVIDITKKMDFVNQLTKKSLSIVTKKNYEYSKNFSWDKTAQLYINAFKKII